MFIFTGYIKLNCIVESLIITIQALLDNQKTWLRTSSLLFHIYVFIYLLINLKGKFEIESDRTMKFKTGIYFEQIKWKWKTDTEWKFPFECAPTKLKQRDKKSQKWITD